MKKLILIAMTLISSAPAFATFPEPIWDCKASPTGRYSDIEIDREPNTGAYIVFYGGGEYWLRREKFQDGTCIAPAIRMRGGDHKGSEGTIYGDLTELSGKQEFTFVVSAKGKKERTLHIKCKDADK